MGKKNKQIIKLSSSFYNKKVIEKTKKEFDGFCKCDIKENKEYFLISVIPRESGFDTLHFEFANYALALMK